MPGHLCEVCLDVPATRLQPAPWGREMGVCAAWGRPDPAAALALPTGACARHPLDRVHSPMPSLSGRALVLTCGRAAAPAAAPAVRWRAELERRAAEHGCET